MIPAPWSILNADCLEAMAGLPADSADAIVTDPPYGLAFMGKHWDHGVPGPAYWAEALRVAKPGAHLLAFGGTRTFHRLVCAIEDAGWEVRDALMWVYGSGFPKSHDVSKAIDKAAGAEREVVGSMRLTGTARIVGGQGGATAGRADDVYARSELRDILPITAPATPAARQWAGWGTALKPAYEPILLARKPLAGTVAENVLRYGVGGLNVDGCRVPTNDSLGGGMVSKGRPKVAEGWDRPWMHDPEVIERKKQESAAKVAAAEALGRWPANLIHDGSDEVVGLFPHQRSPGPHIQKSRSVGLYGPEKHHDRPSTHHGDSGSAARFFQACPPDPDGPRLLYHAKASKRDRDGGCEGLEERAVGMSSGAQSAMADGRDYDAGQGIGPNRILSRRNHHPTVKPVSLMRYLCRLITPPGGLVLDPFMGSGSTGKGALLEGFRFLGIDKEAEYCEIAAARLAHAAETAEAEAEAGPLQIPLLIEVEQ